LGNLRNVFASGDPEKYLVPDDALAAFLEHCSKKIGDAYFRTPRNTIKAFVDMLSVLEQSDNIKWHQLIERIDIQEEINTDMPEVESETDENDELSTFKL
jgi:hypothetical protein